MFVSKTIVQERVQQQQRDEKVLLLKPSAMWKEGECVARKFAVSRKDYQECLFSVPNHVQCFIK